jgi:Ca2+-binding RTX toxin-like protein
MAMADDLNLFELDEDSLAGLVPGQRSRAVSSSQAVELSKAITVGGRIDLSADAEAEAVALGLNQGDAYTEEVLAQAHALGVGAHQDSVWDPSLFTADPDGLLQISAAKGGSITVDAAASSSSDYNEITLGTEATAIGWADGNLTFTSSAPLVVDTNADALTNADGTGAITATEAEAYGIDGRTSDDPAHTVTIKANVEADALAHAQLSGSGDEALIKTLSADGVGINQAEVMITGTGFVDSTGSATLVVDNPGALMDGPSASLRAVGYGVQSSTIVGDGNGDTDIIGRGLVNADFGQWAGFTGEELDQFVAMGFNDSTVILGKGADHVIGVATQNIMLSDDFDSSSDGAKALDATLRQSAGIYKSAVNTGSGDDVVEGRVEGTGVLDNTRGRVQSFVDPGTGNDIVRGAIRDSVVLGGSGDDRLELSQGYGSIIDGGSGDDRIAIEGISTDMQLLGGTGEDILIGGSGNDTISGGTGSDVLRGGKGADTFVFDVSSFGRGTDLVSDFNRGEGDKIQLASAITGINKGATASFMTAAMAESTNKSTAFIYDTLQNIQGQSSSKAHMAYAYDQGALLFDQDGDWTQGNTVLAVVRSPANQGGLKTSDIEFV